MTVAAAGCVSGELIISVCRLWWGWSCDTGNNHTVSPFWCWSRRRICMCAYVFMWRRIYLKCFTSNRETLTHSVVQLSLCSACGTCVYTFACVHFLSHVLTLWKWHRTSVRCHCGDTAGVGCRHDCRGKGGEGESEMASGEIEQNERRQEERRRDDQINHVGHFIAVRKGLIYPPPLCPHSQKANFSSAIRQQGKQKWLCELQPEVSYYWQRVCAVTHHGGLSLLQQLATAPINTLVFVH